MTRSRWWSWKTPATAKVLTKTSDVHHIKSVFTTHNPLPNTIEKTSHPRILALTMMMSQKRTPEIHHINAVFITHNLLPNTMEKTPHPRILAMTMMMSQKIRRTPFPSITSGDNTPEKTKRRHPTPNDSTEDFASRYGGTCTNQHQQKGCRPNFICPES